MIAHTIAVALCLITCAEFLFIVFVTGKLEDVDNEAKRP